MTSIRDGNTDKNINHKHYFKEKNFIISLCKNKIQFKE